MQRVVDARTPEQLDIFVRGSEQLEHDLQQFAERPHYDHEAMQRISSGLAALRHSPLIRETTVDVVLEFVDTATRLSGGEHSPVPGHAMAMSIGSRAAATVCRFEGVPDGTVRDMYDQSSRLFMWLDAHETVSTPRQRAMSAIDVATISGQRADISCSYRYIDRYLAAWRASLPQGYVPLSAEQDLEKVESVRMLTELAAKDRTNGSIIRLRKAHALPSEVQLVETGLEPNRVNLLLQLCLQVGILEKQPKLIPRLIRDARREDIVPTDDEVLDVIRPFQDNQRQKVFDRIRKELEVA